MIDLRLGDCREVLKSLADNSVDSCVTDPPYGLEFMGKDWDAPWKGKASREFNEIEAGTLGGFKSLPNHSRVNNVKCLRCDKWRFSSNRCKCDKPEFPNARLGAMVEFQLWCQEWASEVLRVLKPGGHILAFGGTRTYHRLAAAIEDAGFEVRDQMQWLYGSGFPKSHNLKGDWSGWGTALKPANEPIVLARKPLSEPTVAANVLKWGTGALNIEAGRIGMSAEDKKTLAAKASKNPTDNYNSNPSKKYGDYALNIATPPNEAGRWPANLILDEEAGRLLDEQSGDRPSKMGGSAPRSGFWGNAGAGDEIRRDDTGGASRFFYCAKASRSERGEGNGHPTVKPIKLMEYLARLVTPPGGVILEPFLGSGTTALACKNLGYSCVGIEQNEDYLKIARARVGL